MVVELKNYEERIIVFIDILGFREHINKTVNSNEYFLNLRDTLNFISELETEKFEDDAKEITVFSDSIVISYPVEIPGSVFSLILDVIHIQLDMMSKGILLRGGITVGQLCHKDNIVYGPAMVEAYELESKSAIYPRVIISEKVFLSAALNPDNSIEEDLEWITSLLERDRDGQWYVDFLRQQQEASHDYDYFKALLKIKKLIVDEIEQNETKPNVQMKYEWLKSYFNEAVKDLDEDFDLIIS